MNTPALEAAASRFKAVASRPASATNATEEKTFRFPSLAERALTIGGSVSRLATGFATLDKNTRGGPRVGKRIVIGGAPGAGKTTWLVQMLWQYATSGCLTLFLAYDEEAEDIIIRIGQINGIDRDELERGDQSARRRLSEIFQDTPNFLILDGGESEVMIEQASVELSKLRAPGQFSVLGVDSIQTARVIGDDLVDGPRARVDLVMKALKDAGKNGGHLVFATCELARGAYRSLNPAERIDDLAAFKESGGVEYAASMAMVLRPVKDQDGLVDVRSPKNRMGTKAPFRLSLNSHTASFREVSMPDSDEVETTLSPLQRVKDKIFTVIEKTLAPIGSVGELGRRVQVAKSTASKAINELIEDGRVAKKDGAYCVVLNGSEPVPNRIRRSLVPGSLPLGEPEPEPLGIGGDYEVVETAEPEPLVTT